MKCSCPKCSSSINVDEPAIPEKGNFSRCPDCNSRFWLHREPFLMRAYKKDWKAFCSYCGDDVGSASYCESCYQAFPEYWVVQTSRPARRKSTYKADISISLPGFKLKKTKTVEKLDLKSEEIADEHFDLEHGETSEEKTSTARKPLVFACLAVLLVAGLIVFGGSLFKGNEQHEMFVKDYIRALYGVTAGADFNIEKLQQLASGTPLSTEDSQQLQGMKANLEKYRQKVSAPPAQFVTSVDNFEGVYRAYVALHTLAVTTSVVTPAFQGELDSLMGDLDQAELKLKNGLSDDMRANILKVTDKYPSLNFIGE